MILRGKNINQRRIFYDERKSNCCKKVLVPTGTKLMKRILLELKNQGYKQTSLSVQKKNYAVRMYHKVGFHIVEENDEEYIMVCKL